MTIFVTLFLLLNFLLWYYRIKKATAFRWIDSPIEIFVLLSNFLLFGFLLYRWFKNGYFPLSNLYESLLFLAWCLTLLQLVVASRTDSQIINIILMPIGLFVIALASFLPHEMQMPAGLVPALQSTWLVFHVSMMIASYATLVLGSLLSILLLILIIKTNFLIVKTIQPKEDSQNIFKNTSELIIRYEAKFRDVTAIVTRKIYSSLSLITYLDIWGYRIIGIGYIALTLGILAGSVWANESWGSYWSWDPKETWSLITWLIFTIYLHARLINNWKGFRTALIGSIGFIAIWISYLGVNFLANGLHSYGWVN